MYKYLKSLRFDESIAMSGFFLVGGVFAVKDINIENIKLFFNVFLISVMLIVSIYAFNAFGGYKYDYLNLRLDHLTLKKYQYVILSITVLFIAVVLGFFLSTFTGTFVLLIFVLWMLYSFPRWGFKNKPFIGTGLHFAAQILHFLMGYSVFSPINHEALLISIYFSMIFAAGHLFHEIIDYEPDKKSGSRTGAVVMGFRLSQFIVMIIFSLAAIYWMLLYYLRNISLIEMLSFTIAFILQLLVWIAYRRKFFNIKARIQYRMIYRTLYCLSGLIVVISRI